MKAKSMFYGLFTICCWIGLSMSLMGAGCGAVQQCMDNADCAKGQQCVSGTCKGNNGGGGGGNICKQDGKEYKPGDSFPSSDGCNTCSCSKDGNIQCTLRACVKDCKYNGKTYKVGDRFPSTDGCNTCTCDASGQVACTEKACPPPPKGCEYNGKKYQEGDTFPSTDGCNTCSCDASGQVICTKKACPPPTGCNSQRTCPPNSVCIYNDGTCKPSSNDSGKCVVVGQACTKEYAPMCGCDGKTYDNPCSAHQAGVTIASRGKCGTDPGSTCKYNGKVYKEGDTFPSTDGCNSCTCGANGQIACTERACAEVCGGLRGLKCKKATDYCHIPKGCGFADETGICKPKPQSCTEQYEPVCGCDGKTYGNPCNAAAAGVSIAARGECKTTKGCGTRGAPACGRDEYCNQPTHCGATDIPGACAKKPQNCTQQYDPVCGCDNKTYGNACGAASAGVSVKSKGKCTTTPTTCKYNGKVYKSGDNFPSSDGCNTCTCDKNGMVVCTQRACTNQCGGIAGLQCKGKDEYCAHKVGTCRVSDRMGTCAKKPGACTQQYDPVCGCDGKTYGNACSAASQGMSISHKGECKAAGTCQYNGKTYKQGDSFPSTDGCNTCSCGAKGAVACTKKACAKTCGGIAGITCKGANEYCAKGTGVCLKPDSTGVCTEKPGVCNQIYAPVCGCDGKTYGNACSAASAGVSVAKTGKCAP